jgi:hypothetical protein
MRFFRGFSLLIGLVTLMGTALVAWFFKSNNETSPVSFVEHTYEVLYQENSDISSLDKAKEIYSTTLLALITNEQQEQIKSGELGKLSADPLCNCQDPGSVQKFEIVLETLKEDHATVLVSLKRTEAEERLKLDLVLEAGGWKIDDVAGEQTSGFREALLKN